MSCAAHAHARGEGTYRCAERCRPLRATAARPSLRSLLLEGRSSAVGENNRPSHALKPLGLKRTFLSFLYRKEFQNRRFSLKCCKNVAMLQKIVLDQWSNCKNVAMLQKIVLDQWSNCKKSCLTSEFDHWSNHWPPQCIIYPTRG